MCNTFTLRFVMTEPVEAICLALLILNLWELLKIKRRLEDELHANRVRRQRIAWDRRFKALKRLFEDRSHSIY